MQSRARRLRSPSRWSTPCHAPSEVHSARISAPSHSYETVQPRERQRERACRVGAAALHLLVMCSVAALTIPLAQDGLVTSATVLTLLLLVHWLLVSVCTCSKLVLVASWLVGATWQPLLSGYLPSSWDVATAWLPASIGFTAAIGAAAIRLPHRTFAFEVPLLQAVAHRLGAVASLFSTAWLDAGHGRAGSATGTEGAPGFVILLLVRLWCMVCVAAVEVAMIPGAALSVVTAAALSALGGDVDHELYGSVDGVQSCDTESEAPLVILLHGHGFNAAMWGRYTVSFTLAGYSTMCVSYERYSRLLHQCAPEEGIAQLAEVAAREIRGHLPRRQAAHEQWKGQRQAHGQRQRHERARKDRKSVV